jgi:hypothetical protein
VDPTAPSLNNYSSLNASALTPAPQLSPKKKPLFLRLFIISLVLVFAGMFLVGGVMVGAAYSPSVFSFVPAQMRINVNRFLLNTPAPKNLEQILLAMRESTSSYETFRQKVFFELATEGLPDTSPLKGTFAFRTDGSFDMSEPTNPEFDQSFTLLANVGNEDPYQVQGEVIMQDQVMYANVTNLSEALSTMIDDFIQTSQLTNQWYSFDFGEFTSELPSTEVDTITTELPEEFSELAAKMTQYFENLDYYNYLKLVGSEEVSGRPTYHIQFNKTGSELRPFMSDIIDFLNQELPQIDPEAVPMTNQDKDELLDLLNYFDRIIFDLYLDQDNYYIVRTSFDVVMTPPLDMASSVTDLSEMYGIQVSANLKVHIKMGLEVSEIGVPQSVTVPVDAKPFTEMIGGLYSPYMQYDLVYNDGSTKSTVAEIGSDITRYKDSFGTYPLELQQLVDSGTRTSLPEDNYIAYEYFSDGTEAYIVAFLMTPSSFDTPIWLYTASQGSAQEVTYDTYYDLLDRYAPESDDSFYDGGLEDFPSDIDFGDYYNFPDVQGAFDINIDTVISEWLKNILTNL